MPTTTVTPIATAKRRHRTYTINGHINRALFTVGKGDNCVLLDAPAVLQHIAAAGGYTPDTYFVERGLRPISMGDELNALLDAYVEQALATDAIPAKVYAADRSLIAYAAA
jgi:hypothetical protein